MSSFRCMLGILCLTLMIACKKKKEDVPPPHLDPTLTLISANVEGNDGARIKGKVIVPEWLDNPTYGIVYSADSMPAVNSPGKINMGYIGDSADIDYTVRELARWKNYTFRLYLSTADTTWYSEPKVVVPPSFQLVLKDTVISRNTLLRIDFVEPLPTDQANGFEVYVGDKKIDSTNIMLDIFSISFLVPIDYTQGTPITVKKGLYSQTIVPSVPVLAGYWRSITPHDGTITENPAYFTLGNKGYIVGGHAYLNEAQPVNTIWELDLTTLQWTKKNPFPTTLHSGMAVTVNGKAYLFGGITSGINTNEKVWEYNAAADSWQSIANMPGGLPGIGRLRMATAVYNNKIYMGTGIRFSSPGYFESWYTDYWATFDPATLTWGSMPEMPATNSIQSPTTYISDNRLYLFGGDDSYHEVHGSFVLDFSSNTWTKTTTERGLPPRTGVSVINKNNTTYFFGGYQYKTSGGPSGGRFGVIPECWKMDAGKQYTQLASAGTYDYVSSLNRNAPIFATANGLIVYNVLTWNGNGRLKRAVIEYVP